LGRDVLSVRLGADEDKDYGKAGGDTFDKGSSTASSQAKRQETLSAGNLLLRLLNGLNFRVAMKRIVGGWNWRIHSG
jgi:hypothetical protein